MQQEIASLEKNGTWGLTQLPTDKCILACKCIFKIKHKADGSVTRYKSFLVIL